MGTESQSTRYLGTYRLAIKIPVHLMVVKCPLAKQAKLPPDTFAAAVSLLSDMVTSAFDNRADRRLFLGPIDTAIEIANLRLLPPCSGACKARSEQ